ncbi:hypothetical protein XENOCAPTIV_030712 [Xenoophorus captivus]|uniref:Ubiquitin carboxyl-terminal hydrolase n=1 Tax=Xenoophorus captivus TaxID=1517983 RepID=A0ABV0RJX5_9TELE
MRECAFPIHLRLYCQDGSFYSVRFELLNTSGHERITLPLVFYSHDVTCRVVMASEAKGAFDKLKNSEAPLSTLGTVGCDISATNASSPSGEGGVQSAEKSGVPEVIAVPPVEEDRKENAVASLSLMRCEDQISNGMGHDLEQAAEDSQGGASKLVNNKADCPSSPPAKESTHVTGEVSGCAESEQTELAKPIALCPDSANAADVKCVQSGDHTLSEGLPSGSDPDPSLGGESRSIDSLESFSNLNSCPSSEGLDEKGLTLALQSEYASDGTKTSCAKDRAAGQSIYHIKWIKWREENTPIITQNENGPCPLLAIMNVLLLAWKVGLSYHQGDLLLLGASRDYILETKPKEISEVQRLNYEQVRLMVREGPEFGQPCYYGCLMTSQGAVLHVVSSCPFAICQWCGWFIHSIRMLLQADLRETTTCQTNGILPNMSEGNILSF